MLEKILQRGTLLTVIVLIVMIFGVLAALRVPVQMIPDLEVRTISVQTNWPGATPQDVEKEILIEQEEYLRNVPSLSRMISSASTGRADIELEFPFGTDITEALIRVNNALSQVPAYPESADEPVLSTSSFSANAFIYYRITARPGNPRRLDITMMRDFIEDNVRTRLERIPGVSQIEVRGGAERQIQILVDPGRLAERNITLTQVREAIRNRNRDISGGDLDSGKRRYLLRTVGRYESLPELEETVITRQGDSITRIKDIGEVRLDHYEVRTTTTGNGKPSITLAVRRETGANVIEIKKAVVAQMEEINASVLHPAGMEAYLATDDVRYVEASVANVWTNLAIGAVLASSVMFLFLRSVPATLVGVMGVPICTIAGFIGLLAAGRTINVISLAGIAFAIGMTLDNTIVVLENIERERRNGLGRFQAALAGVRGVWAAVLASTMTTILVFAPVLFVQEEAGQLYSDIAIAISASIFVSMLVAMTIVPAAAARLDISPKTKPRKSGFQTPIKGPLLRVTDWLIATSVRRLACLGGIVAITAGVIVFLTPPAEYLPEGEEAKAFSRMIAPPGYSLSEMQGIAAELEAEFVPLLDDDPVAFSRGEATLPALQNLTVTVQPQALRIISETKDPAHIDAWMEIVTERFREFPGMRAFSSRGSIISSNDGGTRSVNLDIAGPDLTAIYEVALAAYRRAQEVFENPQVNSEPSSLILGQPLLELRPRWERAVELGFTAQEFGYAVAALTDGAYIDEFFLGDDKIDMFLYSTAATDQDIDAIANLPIYAPAGSVVPVAAVADLTETVDTDTIRRLNGRRTVTLNIIPPRSVPLETAVGVVRKDVVEHLKETGAIPSSVSVVISGASNQLDATRESLLGNFIVAVLLSYLLLVVIFKHWGFPFIIMTTVPLGVAGGIVGLWLLNFVGGFLPLVGARAIVQPFDMITMLGFLILLGTVVNNPILIVDRTMHNAAEGLNPQDAVREAVETRLRPILMSTITTICGLAPLVFIPGAGTELYRGVGVIVLSGLLFSTVVTLTFLPCLLVTLLSLAEKPSSEPLPTRT